MAASGRNAGGTLLPIRSSPLLRPYFLLLTAAAAAWSGCHGNLVRLLSVDLHANNSFSAELLQLAAAIDDAFRKFRCVHVLESEEFGSGDLQLQLQVQGILYRSMPVPVMQVPPERGREQAWCRGLLVLDHDLHAAQRILDTLELIPSLWVVLVLTQPNGDTWIQPQVKELGLAHAAAVALRSGEYWNLDPPGLSSRHWRHAPAHAPQSGSAPRRKLFWEPGERDLQGQAVRVVTFEFEPFTIIDKRTDPWTLDGTEVQIVKLLAHHLNFTYEMVLLDKDDEWGNPDGNGSWKGGGIGALVSDTADLALNTIWLQEYQARMVDMTTTLKTSCVTFLVPRPRILQNSWAPFLPLDATIWAAWISSLAVTALASLYLEKVVRRCGLTPNDRFHDFPGLIVDMLGMGVGASIPVSAPSMGPHRHVVAWWVIFSVLMTTAYSSGLVSHLTQVHYEPRLDSIRDVLQKGLIWGSTFKPNMDILFDLQEPANEAFSLKWTKMTSETEWLHGIKAGKFAIQGQTEGNYFTWPGVPMDDQTLDSMRVIKECSAMYYTTFALQRNSPLLHLINKVLSKVKEAGIEEYWRRNVLYRLGRPAVFRLKIDDEQTRQTEPTELHLHQLLGVFEVLLCGLALATVSFLAEKWVYSQERAAAHSRKVRLK